MREETRDTIRFGTSYCAVLACGGDDSDEAEPGKRAELASGEYVIWRKVTLHLGSVAPANA